MPTPDFLLRYRSSTKAPSAPVDSPLGHDYDETLIAALVAEHGELMDSYGRIWEDYIAGRFREVMTGFEIFRTQFIAHLLKEDSRFYQYLIFSLQASPDLLATAKGFRSDMDKIAQLVMHFSTFYSRKLLTGSKSEDFGSAYNDIGEALTRRIMSEEKNLYQLYRPMK